MTHSLHFVQTKASSHFTLEVYIDAAMTSKEDNYPRGGYIVYRLQGDYVHPIHWHSKKPRRTSISSSTAEILAGADGFDIGIYLSQILAEVFYEHKLNFFLVLDLCSP